jgi:dihydrofolate synthase/folylpolyglutamate synthase
MSFASAVEHLHALGLELAPSTTTPRRKFDLEHMRILARALGDPQTQFPSILIAGTNGKGSTAATLSSILAAAGLRTGLYTSPHLTRVTERIRTSDVLRSTLYVDRSEPAANGQRSTDNLQRPPRFPEIPEDAFARLYFQVDEAANRLVSAGQLPHHPSFFETLTALAFLYFAEQHVDIAVLEVGLGGRLDATNIVEPILSVITDIALDHQEYLGNTIAEIAREKAGILRPNGTLITLPQHPEANRAIGEAAIALNVHAISATDYLPGRNFHPPELRVPHVRRTLHRVDHGESTPPNQQPAPPLPLNHYTLTLENQPLEVRSPLAGEHQQRNIALAIAAAIELRNHFSNKSPTPTTTSNQTRHKFTPGRTEPPTPRPQPATDNLQPATNLAPRPPLEPRTSNLEPSVASIELGIATTSWPGRLEFLPPNLLLDVAHNPAGAWTLRAAIASLPEQSAHASSHGPGTDSRGQSAVGFSQQSPRTLIFSCLRDKDLREMAQILFPLFDSTTVLRSPLTVDRSKSPSTDNVERTPYNLILTPINSPRAASLDDLVAAARALDIPAHPTQDPAEALALARALTPANGLIFATGSIYLIGALRDLAS